MELGLCILLHAKIKRILGSWTLKKKGLILILFLRQINQFFYLFFYIIQIDSAMALTSFNTVYVGNEVNKFFSMNGKVTVNTTVQLVENPYTR